MTMIAYSDALNTHPVDVVEQIAASHAWDFEREDADEISISVAARWCDYEVSFTWLPEMEALHLTCAFALGVPERRMAEVAQLTARLNARLWVGHFDFWSSKNAVMFRHAVLLPGGTLPESEHCERLLKIAVEACEQAYQAFQFVVWAGKTADQAMENALFETAGEA